MRLSAPSPFPTLVWGFMFWVGGVPAPAGTPPPPPPPPPPPDVPRNRADVDHVPDAASLDVGIRVRLLTAGHDQDLLRTDRHVPALSFEDVGDPDEAGDEVGGGTFVRLHRRADLLDPAGVHHG